MRQLLSGLVLVTALPLLVLDLVLYQQLASAERRSVRDRLMDNVHVLSSLVDNEIDTHIAVASTLSISPALATGDLKAFADQAQRASDVIPGASITLSDSAGHPVALASPAADDADGGQDLAEIVAQALSSGKPQVSDIAWGLGGKAAAFVVYPVMKPPPPRYALVIGINLDRFRGLIVRDFGQKEVVSILDRQHRLVAKRPDYGRAVGALAAMSWRTHLTQGGEGIGETVENDGGRFLTAYAPTRDGWTVGVSLPMAEVDAPVQKILWVTSLFGIGLALLSLGFGRVMAARLSLSMAQLVNHARQVGRGQTTAGRAYMTHEATAISEAMADASREIASGQAALRESESRFRGTFENAAVGVAHVGLDGKWLEINQRLCDIVGYSRDELRARTFQDITHPDDLEKDLEGVRGLLAGEKQSYSLDKRYIRKDGRAVWVGLTVALQRDVAGAPKYFISIVRDIARRRAAEEHQQFLLHELAHRSKNQLAIILAMARITSRNAGSLEAFGDQFAQRIQGLAISSELLVAQHWTGIALADLVRRQLQAFVPAPARLSCEGPDLVLAADAAEAIGLALHELATNSLKHGAWSSPAGMVTLTWSRDESGGLRLSWVERGGPEVAPPARRGFGHEVVDRMVSQKLEGKVELSFAPEGVSWTLSVPPKYLKSAV
ncbi:MAG: PAS domain S-box protein [Xanthobacteraceae bacterium]